MTGRSTTSDSCPLVTLRSTARSGGRAGMPFSYASCQDTFSHFISVCSYVIPTSDDLLAAGSHER